MDMDIEAEKPIEIAPEAQNAALNGRIFKKKKPLSGSDLFECYKNDDVCDVVLVAENGKR